MRRPEGCDSHATGAVIASLETWSATQVRGDHTLGELVMTALYAVYGSPFLSTIDVAQSFGVPRAGVERHTPRPDPRVKLREAMASGWDGELYLSTCWWWRNHWLCPEDWP